MKAFDAVVRVVTVGVLMAIAGPIAAQQGYPNKPIRFITPYPPGGGTTFVARLISPKLGESLGQHVIVDNRPGGNTIIGTEAAAKAPPDGYTILLIGNSQILNDLLLRPPYDILKDFAPVSLLVRNNYILVVNPKLPPNNLQEFIAYAKSRPGQLNVASTGSGSSQHLMGELFNILAGVNMMHIPYKGGAAGITDLMGGQVHASFSNSAAVIPHVKNGRLKGLAVTGDKRLVAVPQVPTYAEAGLPGYNPKNWLGIVVPAGTPQEIVARLSTEVGRILALPEIRERLAGSGQEPFYATPERMAAQMKSDHTEYGRVIKTANIKLVN
ncbi:MAG: tripartite tricarboxylate transporter substrate binding protein [Pseudomonadota bacterium]